jgi:hypothetical protein
MKGRSFSKSIPRYLNVKNLMIEAIGRIDVWSHTVEMNWDKIERFVVEQSGSTDIALFLVVLPHPIFTVS